MLDVEQRQDRELSEREWDVLLRDLVEQQRAAEHAAISQDHAQLTSVLEQLRTLRDEIARLRDDIAVLTESVRAR